MVARPEDLAQLDRLIATVEAASARLAARGADTSDATRVLAKLHDAHATACVWLGGGAEPARRGVERHDAANLAPLAAA